MTIIDAVRAGHVEGLRAMRDKLAEAMDLADPAVVAQVAARLQAVLKELADLDGPAEESAFDDLARRRDARLAAANHAPSSRRGTKSAR